MTKINTEQDAPDRVWLQRCPDGSLDNRIWTRGDIEYARISSAIEPRASYKNAHPARYLLTHGVHPDIVVLFFLALKSRWFEDPENRFYGKREQAKAYLYKWVETGELAEDNTLLEIETKRKFSEWLESSWTSDPKSVLHSSAELT